MKAFQLTAHGTPGIFQMRDIPEPIAGEDDVVVHVRACGLNHLDLWTEQGALPVPIQLPRTAGCEISGVIAATGKNVKDWRVGDRVALQSNVFCGECEFCLRGEESICLRGEILGVHRDGGFAEQILAPASTLVRLPDEVSYEASAALTLAGSTAMHMLTSRTKVRQGDWVLVIGGAGGVGSAAIPIAKNLGAYVIATGSTDSKRQFAKDRGADFVVDSKNPDWPQEVRKLTNKRGVDLVVENVGGDVLLKCFDCLARNGRIVTCGATAGREISLKLWSFFVKQYSLIGSYGRNRSDIIATLHWAAEGRLESALTKTYPLAETAAAFAALRAREVTGKIVVVP